MEIKPKILACVCYSGRSPWSFLSDRSGLACHQLTIGKTQNQFLIGSTDFGKRICFCSCCNKWYEFLVFSDRDAKSLYLRTQEWCLWSWLLKDITPLVYFQFKIELCKCLLKLATKVSLTTTLKIRADLTSCGKCLLKLATTISLSITQSKCLLINIWLEVFALVGSYYFTYHITPSKYFQINIYSYGCLVKLAMTVSLSIAQLKFLQIISDLEFFFDVSPNGFTLQINI